MVKTTKRKRLIAVAVAAVIVVLLAADLFAGNYLVSFALERSSASGSAVAPEPETSAETNAAVAFSAGAISEKTSAWLEKAEREDVEIVSDDGLRLVGEIFPAPEDSHHWVIAVHGYTGRRQHMYAYGAYYAERGYHVLTPDLRAHGESEGRYIGMGWLDRKDILKWIGLILDRDNAAEIVLHGVSMGGGTVMMTAGEDLPENVVAVVDDCGYTSVWDVFLGRAGIPVPPAGLPVPLHGQRHREAAGRLYPRRGLGSGAGEEGGRADAVYARLPR